MVLILLESDVFVYISILKIARNILFFLNFLFPYSQGNEKQQTEWRTEEELLQQAFSCTQNGFPNDSGLLDISTLRFVADPTTTATKSLYVFL